MAKKKIDKQWLELLEQFTEMIVMMGFRETSEILKRIRAGERSKDLEPLIIFYTRRHQRRPPAVRAVNTRRARRFGQWVREMAE
ncbi:MAG: hypothetical protein M3362_12715, partial [Acidobacteriota bacterium]|nr:hypothetical protein [Acidobacteriota bacterium]